MKSAELESEVERVDPGSKYAPKTHVRVHEYDPGHRPWNPEP
jgi:hypothetical protein